MKNMIPERITFEPQIMGGRACIRGMRITVSLVLSLVANGMNNDEIIEHGCSVVHSRSKSLIWDELTTGWV